MEDRDFGLSDMGRLSNILEEIQDDIEGEGPEERVLVEPQPVQEENFVPPEFITEYFVVALSDAEFLERESEEHIREAVEKSDDLVSLIYNLISVVEKKFEEEEDFEIDFVKLHLQFVLRSYEIVREISERYKVKHDFAEMNLSTNPEIGRKLWII